MAALQEKPLREEHREGEDMDDGNEEGVSGGGCGCGCFRLLGIGWGKSNEKESKSLLQPKTEHRETWLNKIKQTTEVLGGPKWKNFIRKIGGYCDFKNKNKKKQRNGFQYDPHSYALNFDNGFDREEEEEEGLVGHDFTSRFAAPFQDEKRPTRL
ncbi:uncharacterized protein LOC132185043 [Corylus avellana]|uniref:uncharacterized protein LOC132185043 n=1 Tax=Corylus avellana TaxID=13451 RepID=UPI001E233F34|nr:uncharacterized protein LOC132185043 [Corylus avellana]